MIGSPGRIHDCAGVDATGEIVGDAHAALAIRVHLLELRVNGSGCGVVVVDHAIRLADARGIELIPAIVGAAEGRSRRRRRGVRRGGTASAAADGHCEGENREQ